MSWLQTPVAHVCRQLEDENHRLKALVADLTLDKHLLAEALRKISEADAPPGAGGPVPGDVWGERRPGMRVGPFQPGGMPQTEFMARALEDWAYQRGVQLDFIRPDKPVENAHIESFNGRLRDECLNVHQFVSRADAKAKIEAWRIDYNQRRPHGSIGHLTPMEYASQRQDERTVEAA